ncbi:type IV pilin protein [Alkalimonas sp.]|uniref:type IV pilin protein n=1 Tax=Alkalimonas sp. TaxID=1872453 RepID=UPI00263AB00C|nr:type IV pilin protein [Alkalimonas sp.]MCC5826452.1 prepilin-type N-terminal cleavage/methylation domain-containing protein [Alkalimonas sp.]
MDKLGCKERGITLIELCLVVVILALLAAIAYPSYVQFVLKSHRVEATEALLTLAARQELYFSEFRRYTDSLLELGKSEPITLSGRYQLSVQLFDDGMSFLLRAQALGTQSQDTECATFSVNQLGQRNSAVPYAESCWR